MVPNWAIYFAVIKLDPGGGSLGFSKDSSLFQEYFDLEITISRVVFFSLNISSEHF